MVGLVGVEWLGCREVGGIARWVGVVRLMGAKIGESGEVRRSVRLAVLILCGSPIRKRDFRGERDGRWGHSPYLPVEREDARCPGWSRD